MPSRYVVRSFTEDSYYHVYNRGVEKRDIFQDEQDYNMFLYYLFVYLASPDDVAKKYPRVSIRLQSKNLSTEVELTAYCLMPNHFHLLLKQNTKDGISKLIKQITNAYTLYFNKKYDRVGGLVQGRFKAVKIEREEILLHVSRYIHLNPTVAGMVSNPADYKWSSYNFYLGREGSLPCLADIVLSRFSKVGDYEKFVLDQRDYALELERIKHLVLET